LSAYASLDYTIIYLIIARIFFFFNVPATTEIYTLSLHDALPIFDESRTSLARSAAYLQESLYGMKTIQLYAATETAFRKYDGFRSEEHTSELQSRENLVCRLLLEKKKKQIQKAYRIKRNTLEESE